MGKLYNETTSFRTYLWHGSNTDTVYQGTFKNLALLQEKANEQSNIHITFNNSVEQLRQQSD